MVGIPDCCPKCGSDALCLSRSGWVRHAARLLFLRPIRCITCGRRAWRFAVSTPDRLTRWKRVPTAKPLPNAA